MVTLHTNHNYGPRAARVPAHYNSVIYQTRSFTFCVRVNKDIMGKQYGVHSELGPTFLLFWAALWAVNGQRFCRNF